MKKLKGTEKQIKWAEDIRKEQMEKFNSWAERWQDQLIVSEGSRSPQQNKKIKGEIKMLKRKEIIEKLEEMVGISAGTLEMLSDTKLEDMFAVEVLRTYLEKNNLIVCTHFHDSELGFDEEGYYKEGYYYFQESDFYTRSRTKYASWKVRPEEVKGLCLEDGFLHLPGEQVDLKEVL